MDAYEATKIVMSRIQSLDPENASKIMGYILIQDQGEKEMIRLAFSPEALLLSYINRAKVCLGLSSNTPCSTPSSSTPLSKPIRTSSALPQTSPRILIPNNGFHSSNPSSPAAAFQRSNPRPFSYAAALNGSNSTANSNSSSNNSPSSLQFYGRSDFGNELLGRRGAGLQDQGQDQFAILEESIVDRVMSPSGGSDSMAFPFHRRSCSVNDAAFLSNVDEFGDCGGFGCRPCMYFAKGFCKNGSSCKFLHGDLGCGDAIEVGSPCKPAFGFDELLRMESIQQQDLALMAHGGRNPFAYNKCIDFLNENPRNPFSRLGLDAAASSSSLQIYLTFPADSTFKEEDVSNYFSMFGPVQDVRIPYQQKRMFGFVTFVYPETVKLIFAKGNPHFVCDCRVLVKPYKEKGKFPDKRQQHQHIGRAEYTACLSPSGIDYREHLDLSFGSRMLLSAQEEMIRRKLEQETELQHAIEVQGRRMMNLQLTDVKNQYHNPHTLPSLLAGFSNSSPRQSMPMHRNFMVASDAIIQENSEADPNLVLQGNESSANISISSNRQLNLSGNDSDLTESLEHVLPDNLLASPTKLSTEHQSAFSEASVLADDSTNATAASFNNSSPALAISSPLSIASNQSVYLQTQRKLE